MRVFSIPALADNYIHLAACGGMHEGAAVIIDPGDSAPVLDFLAARGLRAGAVLITHLHYDHIDGVDSLRRVFDDAPVYAPMGMYEKNDNNDNNMTIVGGGDVVNICGMSFRVLAVPGHTAEHIAFFGEGVLFCGDVLFGGGCGRIAAGCTALQMHQSLRLLAALPDETEVYFGHEYTESNLRFARAVMPDNAALTKRIDEVKKLRAAAKPSVPSTIGDEKMTNPFMRVQEAEVIKAAAEYLTHPPANDLATFTALRKWKDNF